MMRGSRPAFTPMTIDSEVAAIAAADSTLLQSFMVWPAPGRFADVEEFADHLERGLDRLDIRARTGRHHRDRAFFGAAHAAGDRGVDLHDIAGGERLEDALRHHRARRGKIDEALHAFTFDHAVGPGCYFENDIGRRQTRHDCFDHVGDFLRRARYDSAARGKITDRFLARVVNHDLMPGLDQPSRHVRAHIAETDKADIHAAYPSPISSCSVVPGHNVIERALP